MRIETLIVGESTALELLICKNKHIDIYRIGANYTSTRKRQIYVGYVNVHENGYMVYKGSKTIENNKEQIFYAIKQLLINPE